MAKVYNALQLNHIEAEIEKIVRKNKNGFRKKRSSTVQILTIRPFLGVSEKNLEATLLFIDFSKAFDSMLRGKMGQILLAYDLTKETAIRIL